MATGEKVDMYRKKHDELKYHEIEACKDCNAHSFQKDKLWAKKLHEAIEKNIEVVKNFPVKGIQFQDILYHYKTKSFQTYY